MAERIVPDNSGASINVRLIERFRLPVIRLAALPVLIFIVFSLTKWNDSYVGYLLFAAGCFLAGAASAGRLWCSLYIGGYVTNILVTRGPYSMCRHPLYFFNFTGCLGVGLATRTFCVPAAIALFFFIYYSIIVRSEEADLLRIHGRAFRYYRESTPAFFPHLSLLLEPDNYVAYPRIFRRRIFDALRFVWMIGLLEIINGLHEIGGLPVFWHLY